MEQDFINELLGITENYKMPDRLLDILLSEDKNNFLDEIAKAYDFSKDDFRDYFQSEHSNRDKLKQDYTPDCICKIIALLSSDSDECLDVCSGTGALSLGLHSLKKAKAFTCEELSERALPVLICNLALRNVNATVLQKDVLTSEVINKYMLIKGEKYSNVERINVPEMQFEAAKDKLINNDKLESKDKNKEELTNKDKSKNELNNKDKTDNADAVQLKYLENLENVNNMLTTNIEKELNDDIKQDENKKYNLIISNPPYSLSWSPKMDKRFKAYALPPKNKADYAFVLDIVDRMDDDANAFVVLPVSVLFRGSSEGKIREQLINNNLINAIICLPGKLFMNTSIPVIILNLKKNKQNKDILFINAEDLHKKERAINIMTDEHINKLISIYNLRSNVDRLSHVASYDEIKENDFNLNVCRYIDTFSVELLDFKEDVKEFVELDRKIKQTYRDFGGMLCQLEGNKEYYEDVRPLLEWVKGV